MVAIERKRFISGWRELSLIQDCDFELYCLYISEITNYRAGNISKLEKIKNIVGRWGLGTPRCTAVEANRGDMGWNTLRRE